MTSTHHTIFPIKFTYNGVGIETKAAKYGYKTEVLYKIALPSSVSEIQQCWISKNSDVWKLVMGGDNERKMMLELISAITKQEQVVAAMPQPGQKLILKSA